MRVCLWMGLVLSTGSLHAASVTVEAPPGARVTVDGGDLTNTLTYLFPEGESPDAQHLIRVTVDTEQTREVRERAVTSHEDTVSYRHMDVVCTMTKRAPEACLFAMDEWLDSLAKVLSPAKAEFAKRLSKVARDAMRETPVTRVRDREKHALYGQLYLYNSMRVFLEETFSAVVQTQVLPSFLATLEEANGLYWVQSVHGFRRTPVLRKLSLGVIQAAAQAMQKYDGNQDSFGDLQVAIGRAIASPVSQDSLRAVMDALAAEDATIASLLGSPHSNALAKVLREQEAFLKESI